MRKPLSFVVSLIFFVLTATPTFAAPAPGTRIKLGCPAKADVNDPCKAVYFYGSDGKRHAFPNEHVYFSWYADFAGVQTVSSSFLAAIPLGSNVTYRPGIKMVKFTTLPKTYAVDVGGTLRWVTNEQAAVALYGADWNKKIDDVSDVFFGDYRYGTDVTSLADFDPPTAAAYAPTIDQNLDSTFRTLTVSTSRGTFTADTVTLLKDRFTMHTATGNGADCSNNCIAKTLKAYATAAGATIGIHGTYFCPPDYSDCAAKINTFLSPVYDSTTKTMVNAGSLAVHEGPMLVTTSDGTYSFYHRTKDYHSDGTISAAIANYPSLIENGVSVVANEARLAETNPTVKSSRGGIGYNDKFVFLVIAKQANVEDLAAIMQTLHATNAMNLDGGGSTALLYDGTYMDGPGRELPNAILFSKK